MDDLKWYFENSDGWIQRSSAVDAVENEATDDDYEGTPTYAEVVAEFEKIRHYLDAHNIRYEIAKEDCLIDTGDFYLIAEED